MACSKWVRSALVGSTMSAAVLGGQPALAQSAASEWRTYGHDKGGMRFSPLRQITPQNVGRLELAWTYATTTAPPPSGGGGGLQRNTLSQQTPLVVDGLMYMATLSRKVVALDAATGKEVWSRDAAGPLRALEYWPGDARNPPSIIFVSGATLVSLNAKTGQPTPGFGRDGVAGGRSADGEGPEGEGGGSSAVPIVYKNIIVSTVNPYGDGRNGDVRGFDAATGKQLWRFDSIPKSGVGADTWPASPPAPPPLSSGAVGVWGMPTVDEQRGIVYAMFDSPQWERWGGDRVGDNLFGNSLVALDATTGKRLWHYQIVHHDLWDLDLTGNTALFDVRKDGRTIPAVAVVGKPGLMFILDRVTGKPIHGVVETPVAKASAPGEVSSPTQPIPVKPQGVARTSMRADEIAQVTPEHTAACKAMVEQRRLTFGGPYNPPGWDNPTVNFPGANGAGNYGGMSVNPELGYAFVNTQDLGQITQVGPRGSPAVTNGTQGVRAPASAAGQIPYDMVGFNGRFAIMQPVIMPCQAPPWGSLTAVNVHTGDIAWRVPLGVTESLPADKRNTGRPNLGGPIATASGLVFIGASDDAHFRAFDARDGKVLWDVKLPVQVKATPITFADKAGRQYVAVMVGTNLNVYALPGG